ncbi:hypothetical protein [Nocardioides yefusunii]|uniref:Uncharacterized protein n=1 Tax=Nocardioides yefusunii TaxID=2500546 RepID=A0ABW1QVK2_9ACTN|nr:hypothetical protein [Nocardioides yefusunii]
MTSDDAAATPLRLTGVHLERTEDNVARIDALADVAGGRVGFADVVDNLKFTARESLVGRLTGRAVDRAIAWNAHDSADPVWWPQGVTTSADAGASGDGTWRGRRLVVTTSYAKPVDGVKRGSRISVLDLDTLRYRHVLLVDPHFDSDHRLRMAGVNIHAGGIVWAGDWLHVAATGRGFLSFHLDDLMRVGDDNLHPTRIGVLDDDARGPRLASFGHHYVLPVRHAHRAFTDEGHEPLRYSFLSLDRSSTPPGLLAGEYGRGQQSTRLARYELDPATGLPATDGSGTSRPVRDADGVVQMQGVALAQGRHHVSVSRGPFLPGSMYTGTPGSLKQHWFALPVGPEDLSYWPQTDRLWSVTEHPRRRWVVSMRRSWFD